MIGVIAPYCSANLKKATTLNWLEPGILMYSFCQYHYKQKEMLYQRAFSY